MKIKFKNNDSIWLDEKEGYNYLVGIDTGLITVYEKRDCGPDWCPIRIRLYSFPLETLQCIEYGDKYD